MDKPDTPSSDDIAVIESFVISLYSVSCTVTCQQSAPADIRAIVSHFRVSSPTKAALVEQNDTPSGICMVPIHHRQASVAYPEPLGLGQIRNRLGTILDCPPSSRQSHECVGQLRMHHKVHWKVFMLQEGSCVHSSIQMLRTLLWALQSSSYVARKLTTLLSCSLHNTTSTEHSIVIYCMLL